MARFKWLRLASGIACRRRLLQLPQGRHRPDDQHIYRLDNLHDGDHDRIVDPWAYNHSSIISWNRHDSADARWEQQLDRR